MRGLANITTRIVFILICIQGCGGSESGVNSSNQADESQIEQLEKAPSTSGSNIIKLVPFDYQSKSTEGKLKRNAVVSQSQLNSVGSISSPSIQDVVRGNLTVVATGITDPDGINKLYLGFNGATQAQVLCEQDCADTIDVFQTGVNPYLFSQQPGSIVLEIWLEDGLGQRSMVASQQINWLPKTVIINDVQRSDGVATINWSTLPDYLRYNVYLANEPIDNPTNISQLGESQFSLSLTQTSQTFEGLDTKKNYYIRVTAIDGSGESAFSENRLIQASDILIPELNDDAFQLAQFASITGNVLSNDNDRGVGPLIVNSTPVRSPENGTLTLEADGAFTYQPIGSFYGIDSFRYRVTNAQGVSAEANVTLTIEKINIDPVALYNQFVITQNTVFETENGGLLVNDFDLDGDQLSIDTTPVESVANGVLTLQANGDFSYQPNSGFEGEDSFVYRVLDGQGGTHTAKVDLKVSSEPIAQAPIAMNDEYATDEDIALDELPPGFLANDSLAEGVELSISIFEETAQGNLELTNEGQFRYVPSENFYGTDYFIYELTDQFGNKAAAFVELQINSVNDAPVAIDDSTEVAQGDRVTINVLLNDFDIDGELAQNSLKIIEQGAHGTVELNSTNTAFIYQSQADFKGSDYFAYTVDDDEGLTSNIAFVYVQVTGENTPPVAVNDSASTYENEPISITILLNDNDPDGTINTESLEITSRPENGSAEILTSENVILYTPNEGFVGLDSFKYRIRDNLGALSNIATVEIQVMAINAAPIAQNDSAQLEVAGLIAIDILSNDVDSDGTLNPASILLIQSPMAGQVTINSSGILEYKHLGNEPGVDTFTYQVADNFGAFSNTATVTVTITAPNTTPVAIDDSAETDKNQAVNIAVLTNDDNRGQALDFYSFEFINTTSNGEIEFDIGTANVIYTPNNNFVGSDSFTYVISNSMGEQSNEASVSIDVIYKNYAPTISNGSASIQTDISNGSSVFQVVASDPDEDSITYQITEVLTDPPIAADDIFAISEAGLITVNNSDALSANGAQTYSLQVTVCDSGTPSLCNSATITIEVSVAQITYSAKIDTSFANNGELPVQLRASLEYHLVGESVQLTDGAFLIASGIGSYDNEQSRNIHRASITKVNAQGLVDKSFASFGVFSSDFGIRIGGLKQNIVAVNLAIGADNKIYVAGYLDNSTEQGLLLFRLTSNGELDLSYGPLSTGYIHIESDADTRATPVSMVLDGQTAIVIYNSEISGTTTANMVRVSATGTISSSLTLNAGTKAKGHTLLPSGHIMMFGTAPSVSLDKDLLFVKVAMSNLTLDSSYKESGYNQIDIANAQYDNTVYDLQLLSTNHLIATGSTVLGSSGQKSAYLLKMDLDGNLISEFGSAGVRTFLINELPTPADPMIDLSFYDAEGLGIHEVDSSLFVAVNRTQYESGYAVQILKTDLNGAIDNDWVADLKGITLYESSGVFAKGSSVSDGLLTLFGYKQRNLGYNYFANQWLASIDLSGVVNNNFGSLGQSEITSGSADERAIAASPSTLGSKILISGEADSWQTEAVPYVFKIDAMGKRDTLFANLGLKQMGFYSSATNSTVLENADNSILIAGNEGSSAYIGKFTDNGNIDSSFGLSEGKMYLSASEYGATDPMSTLTISNMYRLPTENALALGLLYDGCVEQTLGLHISMQGTVLSHFLFTPPGEYTCNDHALQINEFHVTNSHLFGIGHDGQSYTEPRLVLTKVDLLGQLDTSFGVAGISALDISAVAGQRIHVNGYLIDSDNHFVVYGRIDNDNFIARVSSLGLLDTSFGSDGVFKFTQLQGETTTLKKVWQQSTGELILFTQASISKNIHIARLLSTGSLDTSFNDTGTQLFLTDMSADLVEVVQRNTTESFSLILQNSEPQRIVVKGGLIEPN